MRNAKFLFVGVKLSNACGEIADGNIVLIQEVIGTKHGSETTSSCWYTSTDWLLESRIDQNGSPRQCSSMELGAEDHISLGSGDPTESATCLHTLSLNQTPQEPNSDRKSSYKLSSTINWNR